MQHIDRIAVVRELPLHRTMGLQDLTASAGRAEAKVLVGGEGTLNPAGMLHGGVLYTLCDVCAYAATLSLLEPAEEAVTHNLYVSVLRAGTPGMEVELVAEVRKRGRQLVFIDVQAAAEGKTLATATVTKSIIEARG